MSSDPPEFKSPLDKDLHDHGHRYGLLMHFAKAALEMSGSCTLKHMPTAPPYLHNKDENGVKYDEACVRCNLEKAIEHANREGWKGLEWTGEGSRRS